MLCLSFGGFEKGSTADCRGDNSALFQLNGVPDTPGRGCPSVAEAENHKSALFTELADLIVGQRNARGFFPDDDEVFGTKALPDLCLNLVDKQIRIHFAGINESPNLSRQRSSTGSNGNRLSRLREGWLMNRYRQCRLLPMSLVPAHSLSPRISRPTNFCINATVIKVKVSMRMLRTEITSMTPWF